MKQEYQTESTAGANGGRSLTSAFSDRYATWSPPIRFLFWLGLGLILYFGVIENALEQGRKYGAAADVSADLLVSVSRDSRRNRDQIVRARDHWGPRTISESAQGSTDLQKVINEVLERHGITAGVTIKDIGESELRGSASGSRRRGASNPDTSGQRRELILSQTKTQVQFSAAPDVVIAVLADLERDATVACVQRVTLSRNQSRKVLQVTLVVQSWQRK